MRVLICLLLLCSVCFADNAERITQLQDANLRMNNEIQQAQQYIREREIRIIKNTGAIEILQEQDVQAKKEDDKGKE